MSRLANWFIVAIVVTVALSPLGEFFDKTDGLAQDTSDLGLYGFCLFCFLAFAMRRWRAVVARFISLRISFLPKYRRIACVIGIRNCTVPEDRELFLTFRDLRI